MDATLHAAPGPTQNGWRRFEADKTSVGGALFVPETGGDALPLVVALHGCRQTAGDFAVGTRFAELAAREGFAVLFPESVRSDTALRLNPLGCWVWWAEANQRRDGEPGLIAALLARVRTAEPRIAPVRACVTGLSSGAAMATILAAVCPDQVRSVATHSGVAYSAAAVAKPTLPGWFSGTADPTAALRAFRPLNWYKLTRWATEGLEVMVDPERPEASPREIVEQLRAAMPEGVRPVTVLVLHGMSDTVVVPGHARELIKQVMQVADLIDNDEDDESIAREATQTRTGVGGTGGYPIELRDYATASGRIIARLVEVEGLGHAWSGGSPAGSYTDPEGPDATEIVWEFFRDHAPPA